jgi:serine/threonine-protein kinase
VVEAERRFNEAVALLDAKKYELACPLLEQSHGLDPSSGTLLNLGDCYEHLGRTASAHDAFEQARELAVRTGNRDRARVAEIRKERLTKVLRRLSVAPPAAAPPDLVIRVDDAALALSSSSTERLVDPGMHDIRASAPGYVEYRVSVSAPEPGGMTPVQIPALVPLSGATSAPSDDRAVKGLNGRQIAAIATGAVGLTSVVIGTVFGLRSRSKHEDSDRYCSGNTCRDPRGVELMDQARSSGNASTVAFIVGGIALGTAGALWFIPIGDGATSPQVGLGLGAVRVRRAW